MTRLRGRFGNTSGRPYLEARLVIPRLNLHGDLSLIVDTGADSTMLMPDDARRFGIDHSALGFPNTSTGIGGDVASHPEPAVLIVQSPGQGLYAFRFTASIMEDLPGAQGVPSLLGRDIIDRTRMTYAPQQSLLEMEVLSHDGFVPFTTP